MSAASTSLTLLVWALLSIAALASHEGRLKRTVAAGLAICLFSIFSGLGITLAPTTPSAWLLILLLAATASLGPSTLATSHAAFALSGLVLQYANPSPIQWLGLVHQVALLDIASCSAATVAMVLMGHEPPTVLTAPTAANSQNVNSKNANSRCAGVMRGPLPMLACPIFLRSSLMLLTLIGISLLALGSSTYKSEPSGILEDGILGIWTTVSEVLAAIVAWQIIRGGTPKGQKALLQSKDQTQKDDASVKDSQAPAHLQPEAGPAGGKDEAVRSGLPWSHRIAFAVAGISASLALLLVPLILNAASELDW